LERDGGFCSKRIFASNRFSLIVCSCLLLSLSLVQLFLLTPPRSNLRPFLFHLLQLRVQERARGGRDRAHRRGSAVAGSQQGQGDSHELGEGGGARGDGKEVGAAAGERGKDGREDGGKQRKKKQQNIGYFPLFRGFIFHFCYSPVPSPLSFHRSLGRKEGRRRRM